MSRGNGDALVVITDFCPDFSSVTDFPAISAPG
jgi:hypothetical protein